MTPERAVLFVDGNNWFHALKRQGINDLGQLNYAKVSSKLVGPRTWLGTRYYVGQVSNRYPARYDAQRRYLAFLQRCDPRLSVHLGRIESHQVVNPTAQRLKRYMADLKTRIDNEVYRDLVAIGNATEYTETFAEKAVDVHLAVDMVVMAERNEFETAYLLSADGDFTPAAKAVRECGKKVFAAAPAKGAELAAVVNSFIPLKPVWFEDCFGE